jgi:hypothetical protein
MWRDREAMQNRREQMKKDTFECVLRSSAIMLQAEVLCNRLHWYGSTHAAQLQRREPPTRLGVPTLVQPNARSDAAAVIGSPGADQPSNLIYFPGVTRRPALRWRRQPGTFLGMDVSGRYNVYWRVEAIGPYANG